jgi:hypothetical protein
MRALRQGVEDLIGLPALYEMEERTTEKAHARAGDALRAWR